MEKENALSQYNASLSALSKRTGKIVTALYLVTNCIDDREPVKTRLRTLGVDLVSQVSFAEKSSSFDRGISLAEAALVLSEMTVLVSIAGSVSLISEMNASVLLGAIEHLRESFEKGGSASFGLPSVDRASGTFVITEDMLKDTDAPEKQVPGISQPVNKAGHLSGNQRQTHESNKGQKKDSIVHKEAATKGGRREEILAVVREKKEVSVKDVCNLISGCSEKTIQRELLALVSSGVLKKTGEKRWSKYSFA
jgi:hypothetical protein